jgi:drug/metabolite transporter (DMT)-like permease
VTSLALALVLSAAMIHATWNLLTKSSTDKLLFIWWTGIVGSVVLLPVVIALSPPPAWEAGGVARIAFGAVLRATYFAALGAAYSRGDLSLVYPLARGTGPLLATIAAILLLDERPSALALAGAAIIVLAVLSLTRGSADHDREAVGFALLTGVSIAGYTLWDKHAVGELGLSPVVYFVGTQVVNALVLSPYVLSRRRVLAETWRDYRPQALGVGLLSPLAYILVLFALAEAPVSYVAPAREVSILIAAALGATVLSEGEVKARLAAAGAIVAGIAALAAG